MAEEPSSVLSPTLLLSMCGMWNKKIIKAYDQPSEIISKRRPTFAFMIGLRRNELKRGSNFPPDETTNG